MRTQKYRLWAVPATEEGIAFAQKTAYSRIGNGRILAYGRIAPRNAPDGSDEIRDAEASSVLTEKETEWLMRCNVEICRRFAAEHGKTVMDAMPEFLKRLEEELEKSAKEQGNAEESERRDG